MDYRQMFEARFVFLNKYLTLTLTLLFVKCWFLFLNNCPDNSCFQTIVDSNHCSVAQLFSNNCRDTKQNNVNLSKMV